MGRWKNEDDPYRFEAANPRRGAGPRGKIMISTVSGCTKARDTCGTAHSEEFSIDKSSFSYSSYSDLNVKEDNIY